MTVRISKLLLLALLFVSAAFAFPQATQADAGCPNGSTNWNEYTCGGCDSGYTLTESGYQYACSNDGGAFYYCGTGGSPISGNPFVMSSPLYVCVANPATPPPQPVCTTYTDTRSCSSLAGGAWVPSGYTEGSITFSQEACTLNGVTTWGTPVQTGGSCSQPATSPVHGCTDSSATNYNPIAAVNDGSCTYACVENAQTPVPCAAYQNSFGIPSGATEGSASYTVNSCTGAITYTGGCSAPVAPSGSCSAPTSCGTYPSCSAPDCAGTCGGSATDYNGATSGCGSPPPSTCGNGAINFSACNQCSSSQVMSGGNCVSCSNGGCSGGACSNGGSNPPTCTPPAPQPPATPAPTVSISLATSAVQGAVVPMSYSSTNATSCSGPLGISNSSGSLANISSILSPGNNTIGITCSGAGGSTTSYASINVLVPSVDIMASPMRVRSGNPSTISWSTTDVSSCSITGPNFSSTALSGSQSRTITAQSLFSITCDGLTDSVTVNIIPLFQEF